MLRVAMLARALPRPNYTGGVSGQVHLLATALQRRGHDVTVFAHNRPEQAEYRWQPVGQSDDELVGPHAFAWRASRLPLDDYDLVHTHGDDHLLRTSRPIVRTFYGSARAEAVNAARLRYRAYHAAMIVPEIVSELRATERVAISRTTNAWLLRKATVIPCAYSPDTFFPGGARSEAPSVLFVGDLRTRKRAELLIAAFAGQVRQQLPHAELWAVTTERVDGEGVRWFGRVDDAALADLYRSAWIYCMPSRYEGFGVPYIEALACGTPVIATSNGGSDELFGTGGGGRLVAEGSLGHALVQLLSDEAVRRALGAAAVAQAQRYRIERVADEYLAVYERALQDMTRRRAA